MLKMLKKYFSKLPGGGLKPPKPPPSDAAASDYTVQTLELRLSLRVWTIKYLHNIYMSGISYYTMLPRKISVSESVY